jgi:hypothetical protein
MPDVQCSGCGALIYGVDFVPIQALLDRALKKLSLSQDFSMAIVISAIAIEAQVAQLFVKWRRIESEGSSLQDDQLEDEFRALSRLRAQLDATANLLVNASFDDYVVASRKFGTLSVEEIDQKVARKRNRIVHFGMMDFGLEDAIKACECAVAVTQVLIAMDSDRNAELNRA